MINIKSRISTTPSRPKEERMSEYTINYSIDGWPICKNGEPIPNNNKAKLAELHQLQVRIKELEEELATTRAGWQETIARMASQERPAYDEQQQRIAKLEAINLGLTKTLLEEESEKAKLVGALDDIGASYATGVSTELEKYMRNEARRALAAYRNQGAGS